MNLKNITNDQIDTLLKICKENSNRQKRWDALQNHPISKELDLTDIKDFTKMSCHAWYRSGERKADYLYSVEQIFTGYKKGSDDPSVVTEKDKDGKYIGYDYIRHELSGNRKTEWDFRKGKPIRLKREVSENEDMEDSFGSFVRVILGWPIRQVKALVGWVLGLLKDALYFMAGIGFLILGLVAVYQAIIFIFPPPTEEELAARARAELIAQREAERAEAATLRVARQEAEVRVDLCVSRSERSCYNEPVLTYCGLIFDGRVLGSGCTSTVESQGTAGAQAEFCLAETRSARIQSCEIAEFGCLFVTGDADCNR